MESARSLADKMEKLESLRTQQEYNSSLLSFKTIQADRDCRQRGNSKGRGLQILLTNDGLIMDMSLRRSISAPQMLNCWL